MEGAAQTILSNVGQVVGQEFRQLSGVGGEVAELRDELATMNAVLRMQSEAGDGAVDHFVREWMKQLRELAYDAEDCVDLYLFRIRCRPGDGLLVWSKRLLVTLFHRHRLAGDIAALRARAVAISERHARYGVGRETLRCPASSAPAPSSAYELPLAKHSNLLVGIRDQASSLVDKVKALDENDKELKVFSIVGFGGLGKTTLAMEVCRQLETEFQRQAQVSVSQAFTGKDLREFLKRVLLQIAQPKQTAHKESQNAADGASLGNVDDMDVAQLESKLKEILENSRYLIMINDVWSIAAWDAIRSRLPSSNCGSRIIVTTRIDTVAKACSANDGYIHHMKALIKKDSMKLFLCKAFGSMTDNSCPEDLKVEMDNILGKCGGLPLAIVSIASLLSSYKPPEGKDMWTKVQESIGSLMENNPSLEGMRRILTLSYDHLPHHLKCCMMYLSIFPEDYVIPKDRLLRRWIAEGLVAEKRGMTRMELAEAYFSELVSRSMIQRAADIVTWHDGRVETCRVHDMLLEIMVSKSLEANFVSLVGGQYEGMSYDMARRLSIHGGAEAPKDWSSKKNAVHRGTRSDIKVMTVQHVRSLSIFDPEVHKLLLGRLGEFTLVRVLDLEDCKGLEKKHRRHICRMYLLRFLSLKGTDIKEMPSRVGDLEHLQTLDVRQTRLKCLPKTVTKLEKLEHLLFSIKGTFWSGWMLPRGINKMKALRQVNKAVVIYDPMVAKEIGELDQLQELGIYVDTREDVNQEVLEELACSLSKLYSLRSLDIGNFGCDQWPFKQIMQFLHDVKSPPRLLQYLRIYGRIDNLPDWVSSLADLVEFDIAWTYLDGEQLFNVLCKLPILKRLTLGAYFCWHRETIVFGSTQSFPELKELTLNYSPEVPEVYQFKQGSMPKLETLEVHFGDQEKKVDGIQHLTKLKEVQYSGVKANKGLILAVEELNEENDRRHESEQFKIRVRYDDM
ncbi:disease resistance protein Pik-2-like [Triticum dicoccoides]|uniref:disease resistance protein Pik-2-like n=1 Tax=Triticum dicoccoides TaxID=85692 RepID=UPI00188F0C2B|nr:disease resistance protein Pik-2-like [Triticum dicoccoides]